MTLNVADLVVDPKVADTLPVVVALTVLVFTVKVPVVFPEGIVTLEGTVAALLALDRLIVRPPDGAAVPIATVPVEVFPPLTVAGLSVKPVSTGGLMVRFAETVVELRFPLMLATV